MFFFSSHVTGGSPFGAVPLASGPRQWGQLFNRSWAESSARARGETMQAQNNRAAICFMGCESPRCADRFHRIGERYSNQCPGKRTAPQGLGAGQTCAHLSSWTVVAVSSRKRRRSRKEVGRDGITVIRAFHRRKSLRFVGHREQIASPARKARYDRACHGQ